MGTRDLCNLPFRYSAASLLRECFSRKNKVSAVAKPKARGTPTPAPIPAPTPVSEEQDSWCVEALKAEIEFDPLFEMFELSLAFAVVLGTFEEVDETLVTVIKALEAVVEYVSEDPDFNVAFRGSAK